MDDKVLNAALAGLLHDVGKFTGRAAVGEGVERTQAQVKREVRYSHAEASATFVDNYVPPHICEQGVRAVEYHHKPDNTPTEQKHIASLAHLVRLADVWAAGERKESSGIEQSSPASTPLVSVLSHAELLKKVPQKNKWGHRLRVLELEREAIFPAEFSEVQQQVTPDRYSDLWDKQMGPELDGWRKSRSWNEISPEACFSTLLAILRKYLTFAPSATPWQADEDDRVLPDVSLYDHLKTTAAIAGCLRAGFSDLQLVDMSSAYDSPVAVLVRGDISGIQNFIYRITQPEGEGDFTKVAKRLRGRSFYVGLLGDVVVDWLVRELGVTLANVLFSGGGRFDILAPINCQSEVKECEEKLAAWLLKEFYGELGILLACADVKPNDFSDMSEVYEAVEIALGERKQQKWKHRLGDSDFMEPRYQKYHACAVCHITPLSDPGVCPRCRQHEKIGEKLPYTSHVAFVRGKYQIPEGGKSYAVNFDAPFDTTLILLYANETDKVDEAAQFLSHTPKDYPITIYRLNSTSKFIHPDAPPNAGQSFRFLANSAPRATAFLASPDVEEKIDKGDVLHFDAIARLSDGVKRIGVLKADVDRLGLVFGLGVQPPTVSRLSALSHALDLFFSGWLNCLCQNVFDNWQKKQENSQEANRLSGRVDGLFYVMYSGGDDLFVIGPWDAVLNFAERLYADFAEYAGHNPNITLSAGYIQVKPHYPVQRFAGLADEAEKKAKNGGRDAIHVFGETVQWLDGESSYDALLKFAYELRDDVESRRVPRTLVHDLGDLYRRKRDAPDEKKPIFTPKLYYTLTRRLLKEVRDKSLEKDIIKKLQHIMLPVSYVSLSTRKE